MKRIITTILAAVMCVSLCSCQEKQSASIEGLDEIKKAAGLYENLNAAHIKMSGTFGNSNSTMEMYFQYIDDILHYSYVATSDADVYYEYHNGSEQTFTTGKSVEWTVWTAADDSLYQYTRTKKHTYLSGSILYSETGMSDGKITETDNGKNIVINYDCEKIPASVIEQYKSVGTFKSMKMEYELNADGYITKMSQEMVLTPTDNSADVVYQYDMVFSQFNDVGTISRPVALWENVAER